MLINNAEKQNNVNRITKIFDNKNSLEIIDLAIKKVFKDKVVYVCSFGSESIVMLDMISKVSLNTPIIFLNTLKLFGETILYKNQILELYKFKNFIEIFPDKYDLKSKDPVDDLWSKNSDLCCDIRKVKPLKKALINFDAWFSGRKGFHSIERSEKPLIELQDDKFLISPLLFWKQSRIERYLNEFNLLKHPLNLLGYKSIGCANCTMKPIKKKNIRSGRWLNSKKTECGIHNFFKK